MTLTILPWVVLQIERWCRDVIGWRNNRLMLASSKILNCTTYNLQLRKVPVQCGSFISIFWIWDWKRPLFEDPSPNLTILYSSQLWFKFVSPSTIIGTHLPHITRETCAYNSLECVDCVDNSTCMFSCCLREFELPWVVSTWPGVGSRRVCMVVVKYCLHPGTSTRCWP